MAFFSRRSFVWFLLVALAVTAAPRVAAAQEPTQAATVAVALWPEYDQPQVLVIIRVSLPAETSLPTTVGVPIPPDAAPLTAVAYRDPTSGLVNALYQRQDGETADLVQIEAQARDLQIEFYDDLSISGDQRSYAFTWPGGLSTPSFTFEVQEPRGAEGFETTPPAGSKTTDSLGLTYHLIDLGSQTATEQPSVSLTYRNPSGELTAQSVPQPPALAEPPPSAGGGRGWTSFLPWGLLIAGVLLVGGGLIYYFRVVRVSDRSSRPRHRTGRRAAPESREVDASPVFCHNCGTQATASDRFCRTCGTSLRT